MEPDVLAQAPKSPPFEVVSGLAAYSQHALQLVANAHMEVALFSYDLDHRIYGSEAFTDNLKKLVLQHRRARLRVIVHTPALAMRKGHRLVELGRILSSRIEFRQLSEERQKLREEYLLADERALIYKQAYNDLEARYYANDPLFARGQMRMFEALWQESEPAREFTDLKL